MKWKSKVIPRDLWLTIWGVGLAFAVQMFYDALSTWVPSLRFSLGVTAGCLLALGLIFFRPEEKKKQNNG